MTSTTQAAVTWALTQTWTDATGQIQNVTKDNNIRLVNAVRQYFNTNNIAYSTFDYSDLQPYL